MYQKKQIDMAKEEKLAREKELKIHEDKMHKLNLQVKQFEVRWFFLRGSIEAFASVGRISTKTVRK